MGKYRNYENHQIDRATPSLMRYLDALRWALSGLSRKLIFVIFITLLCIVICIVIHTFAHLASSSS